MFVDQKQGKPDFRIIDQEKKRKALAQSRCFTCGQPLSRIFTFILPPHGAVTGLSREPPTHVGVGLAVFLAYEFHQVLKSLTETIIFNQQKIVELVDIVKNGH